MDKPKKIMVIRHAEKPEPNSTTIGTGVTYNGSSNPESLAVQGWQRAGGLSCLFAPAHGPLQNSELATPQILYASGIGLKSKSMRPQETLTPLSLKHNLAINTDYLKDEYTTMITAVLASSVNEVLVCWEHQDIPAIANQILGNKIAPQTWPGDRFDVVWVFDWHSETNEYTFHQVCQNLIVGDLPYPIS